MYIISLCVCIGYSLVECNSCCNYEVIFCYGVDSERPDDFNNILSYACKVLTLGLLY